MGRGVDLLAGLLDEGDPVCVGREDFDGGEGGALRAWQRLGFLGTVPFAHPAPTCPRCGNGAPYRVRGRYLCNHCREPVDPGELLLWAFDRGAFFRWLAAGLRLRGPPRAVDPGLWQLGTWEGGDGGGDRCEVFYRLRRPLTEAGRGRLLAYRNALRLHGRLPPPAADGFRGRSLSLLDVVREDLSVPDLNALLRPRGDVRFEPHSGALWVGGTCLGEVPVWSKEYFFLARLAADLDHFVPYRDLKRHVLRASGGADETEEATFCQKLKNRIKARFIPRIDRLLVTTNKGDGYRLRGHGEGV
ncbi:MAG TPA: hypothetical protein VD866_13485 [Urbifossiella sp.]|nr:hypothetical protein [Urbifossiella sp.]